MLKLPHFGHLMQRASSSEKTLMLGRLRHREEGAAEDETVGKCHRLSDVSQQTLGDGGDRSPVCCSPWQCKESDMT